MTNDDLDLSAGMVPHGYSALPGPIRRVLSSTGLQLKPGNPHTGAQNMPAIASVDAGSPNTINVEDPKRFNQSGTQTLSHEAVHLWHNNLPPHIQAQIPADDGKDPYNYGGTSGLQAMRDKGMKLWNLPREKAATVVQYYASQGGQSAPKAIRDAYEPWVKDLNDAPLSTIVPSEPDQQGLNTTARPPQGQMYSTQTFAKGDSAPGEMPTHEAGEVTGWDSASGLPIVKRKAVSQTLAEKKEPANNPVTTPGKKDTAEPKSETEHKYKFGNTQVDLPADSDAQKAIQSMQSKIPKEHLLDVHEDQDKPHVTVRYGVKDGDSSKMKDYISKQAPFEAKLGKTMAFPVSEHSEGAAPIVAHVESPDLHRINGEIEKHGNFEPSNFPDYKPHVTVAYVKPEHADKYVGMKDGEGKSFTVSHISVGDRDGNKEDVPLQGETKQDGPQKGAPVKLQNGTTGKIVWLDPKLGIARIKTDDGKSVSVRKGAYTVQPHTQVAAHVRKLPGK